MTTPGKNAPVAQKRDEETGRLLPGTGSANPGGLTKEMRAARDLMRATLSTPEMHAAWRVGYLAQLVAENPIILKDFADRVGGKPKDISEEDATNATAALAALLAALIQRPDRERLEEDLERVARGP